MSYKNIPLDAADTSASLAEIQSDIETLQESAAEAQAHISDTTAAHAASSLSNSPSGNMAGTTLQTAIDELQGDIDRGAFLEPNSNRGGWITQFDDFIYGVANTAGGAMGLRSSTSSGTAGAKTLTAGENVRVGVVSIGSGTALNNRGAIFAGGSNTSTLLGTTEHVFSASGCVDRTPDASNDYRVSVGLIDGVGASVPSNGVYFTINRAVSGTNWVACTTKVDSTTSTDTGIAFSTATTNYQSLRFEVNSGATEVRFYIEGVLVATHTTNIPNTINIGPGAYSFKTASANSFSMSLHLDWLYWRYKLPSGRGTF